MKIFVNSFVGIFTACKTSNLSQLKCVVCAHPCSTPRRQGLAARLAPPGPRGQCTVHAAAVPDVGRLAALLVLPERCPRGPLCQARRDRSLSLRRREVWLSLQGLRPGGRAGAPRPSPAFHGVSRATCRTGGAPTARVPSTP